MPIYQYQCTDCDHQLEALQKISDPKLTDCPACSEPALKKQLTAAAFKLKGTGWYETDFKNSGKKPASPDASADATKPTVEKTSASAKASSESGVQSAASNQAKSGPTAG